MIIAFDMDDTIYEELTYVRSGFRAAANAAAAWWNIDAEEALETLLRSLEEDGRGRQFNVLCDRYQKPQKKWIRALINSYRQHIPVISPDVEAVRVLDALAAQNRRLYLVTDGHKLVQQRKLEALGVAERFVHCYLTNRYGVRHQKPSPRVFELLVARERCQPQDVVYIGDNPHKDFCGIRPLGFRTIRVLQGNHKDVVVDPAQDAEQSVSSLSEILPILQSCEAQR